MSDWFEQLWFSSWDMTLGVWARSVSMLVARPIGEIPSLRLALACSGINPRHELGQSGAHVYPYGGGYGLRFYGTSTNAARVGDLNTSPFAEVTTVLAAQTHRRVIKTHTPLDGLPLRTDVTYLVVGRDPRDVAISMEHHAANMDFEHFLQLRAAAVGNEDLAELPQRRLPSEDSVEPFRTFVAEETPGGGATLTLASVLNHLDTGW
jgi:hypothetical protein